MKNLFSIMLSIIIVAGLFIAAGCGVKNATSVGSSDHRVPVAPAAPPVAKESAGAAPQNDGTSSIERKIVRTGYITLEVEDINQAAELITRIASESGGYVVSSNKVENDNNPSGTVSIRVPADKYDETMAKLRKIAVKVPTERSDSRDVTEEYSDLKARLSNLEATERQYLTLLNRATTVEDILKVQKELSNVRSQIEQTKGRILYLDRTSDMSLIQVSLRKTSSITEKGWDVIEILKAAVNALIVVAQILLGFIIFGIIFSPVWGGIWALVWWLTKRQNRKKVLSPPKSQ